MRFIKKFSLIIFIIALILFGGFILYKFLTPNETDQHITANKIEDIIANAGEAIQEDDNISPTPSPLLQKPEAPQTDYVAEEETYGDEEAYEEEIFNIIEDTPLKIDNLIGENIMDKKDQKETELEKEKNELDLPLESKDPIKDEKFSIENNINMPLANDPLDIKKDMPLNEDEKISSIKENEQRSGKTGFDLPTIEVTDIDNLPSETTDENGQIINIEEDIDLEDVAFEEDDQNIDLLYSQLTSGEPIEEENEENNEDTGFIDNSVDTNTPLTIEAEKGTYSESDIFSDTALFENDNDKNKDNIFDMTAPSSDNHNISKTEKAPKEDLDSEFLAQIDTPEDLFLPDERETGKTPLMIAPTNKISDETEQDILSRLFPSESEAENGESEADILETNQSLSPKNTITDTSLLGEDNLLSDIIVSDDDMSDLDFRENISNDNYPSEQPPLISEREANLPKPALLQKNRSLSPEEKIAVTPFTSMQAGSATCRFEHVIDANEMSEQFRLTVLPPNGNIPLKMEMIQDLSLDKFLTMEMDEIDGYPDQFSSLSVFCKEMTISKRLIESY